MHSLWHLSTFLTFTCSVLFCLHYYIWARLIRDTGLGNPWRSRLTVLLALLGLLIPLGLFFSRFAPRPVAGPVMSVVYTWLGMAFFLNVLLGLADLLKFLAVSLPGKALGKPVDPDRRRFLALLSGGLVLLGDAGVSAAGLLGATAGAMRVKKVRVALRKLPSALEGFRIVQISDIHVGPILGRDFAGRS